MYCPKKILIFATSMGRKHYMYQSLQCIAMHLLVESTIIPVELVTEPATIPGPSDDGTVKLILNVSFPSTILSLITGTLTVVVVAPAGIVAVRVVESKSVPTVCNKQK